MPPLGLVGDLYVPVEPRGVILFAHGSGSSRLSSRNVAVADVLNAHGFATLLFDLLTPAEAHDRRNVFDIPLLAERVMEAALWISGEPDIADLPLGLFGASTGAGAALLAAAELDDRVAAVVSRGGRPDLARPRLAEVVAPTLLIVGGDDRHVIESEPTGLGGAHLREAAQDRTRCRPFVRGARHARDRHRDGLRLVPALSGAGSRPRPPWPRRGQSQFRGSNRCR